ncbi:MAG: hypothetical protein RMA76_05250 [Deltaproteobacteria bacterium]|jgi:hypothetical protein
MKIQNGNRFSPGANVTSEAASTQRVGLSDLTAVVDKAATRLFGNDSGVFSKRITTEQFQEKLREAKEAIVGADRLDVAFQEKVLQDPLLLMAFKGYLAMIASGSAKASAQKKADADVVLQRTLVVDFLDEFDKHLGEMRELRDSAEVDMTRLGLEIIERNTDIQAYLDEPMQLIGTLRQMAATPGLAPEAQSEFLVRMAKAAVQSVQVAENRTPENREAALNVLKEALTKLTDLGSTKSEVMEYNREATRLAKEIDGETGRAKQIEVDAIFLGSSKATDVKAARGRIAAHLDNMIEGATKRTAPLDAPAIAAFGSALEVSQKDAELFARMPEALGVLTEAKAQEDGTPYKAHKTEVTAFNQNVARFVKLIGTVYPDLESKDAKEGHRAACEMGQALMLQAAAMDQDGPMQSLVGQLTRDPAVADKAVEMIREFITNATTKLNALEAAVTGFLEHGQFDKAYELFFDELWDEIDDGQNPARQARMFAAATDAGLEALAEGGKLGKKPTEEWIGQSYLRGIEVALDPNKPMQLPAAQRILNALTNADAPLSPEQTEDLVSKVQTAVEGAGFRLSPFVAGLVGVLARHGDDIGSMNKANELLDKLVEEVPQANGPQNVQWGGANVSVNGAADALAALKTVSNVELLSGSVRRVAELVLRQPQGHVSLARAIGDLGKFANREELGNMVDLKQDPSSIALAFAGSVETTKLARDAIVQMADDTVGTDVKDMDAGQHQAMVRLEAALRLAVPNLMTEKAMVGLVRAAADKGDREVLRLVRSHVPKDLIAEVLKQIDSAGIRDALEGKSRTIKKDASAPDVGEGVPVNVVENDAAPPQE